jgi:hypothetical protein
VRCERSMRPRRSRVGHDDGAAFIVLPSPRRGPCAQVVSTRHTFDGRALRQWGRPLCGGAAFPSPSPKSKRRRRRAVTANSASTNSKGCGLPLMRSSAAEQEMAVDERRGPAVEGDAAVIVQAEGRDGVGVFDRCAARTGRARYQYDDAAARLRWSGGASPGAPRLRKTLGRARSGTLRGEGRGRARFQAQDRTRRAGSDCVISASRSRWWHPSSSRLQVSGRGAAPAVRQDGGGGRAVAAGGG